MGADRRLGYSLIEMVVVLAILMLLFAIVFVAFAPARERGRMAVCMSNLKQIGQAINMYRQDYGGQEPDGYLTYSQLGLPPFGTSIEEMQKYLPDERVWKCPSDPMPKRRRTYRYHVWDDNDPFVRNVAHYDSFRELVARKGEDLIIYSDSCHDQRIISEECIGKYKLLLRLGGHVNARDTTGIPGSEW